MFFFFREEILRCWVKIPPPPPPQPTSQTDFWGIGVAQKVDTPHPYGLLKITSTPHFWFECLTKKVCVWDQTLWGLLRGAGRCLPVSGLKTKHVAISWPQVPFWRTVSPTKSSERGKTHPTGGGLGGSGVGSRPPPFYCRRGRAVDVRSGHGMPLSATDRHRAAPNTRGARSARRRFAPTVP